LTIVNAMADERAAKTTSTSARDCGTVSAAIHPIGGDPTLVAMRCPD
jgi:hypothetical protein